MKTIIFYIHRAYKLLISPLFGNACRFDPPCSDYFIQAIDIHGVIRGSALGIKRICRCHPLCTGGPDPVPFAPVKGS